MPFIMGQIVPDAVERYLRSLNRAADPVLADPAGADGILGGVGAADDDFRVAFGSPTLDASAREARVLEPPVHAPELDRLELVPRPPAGAHVAVVDVDGGAAKVTADAAASVAASAGRSGSQG